MADCAVCYTVDPQVHPAASGSGPSSRGKRLPGSIFDVDYFVAKAKQLAGLGRRHDHHQGHGRASSIPPTSAELIQALKDDVGIPVDLHTHCTPGFGLASVLMAMVNGVDIVDTVILSFSGGPAAPAYEIVQIFADKLGPGHGRRPRGGRRPSTASSAPSARELAKFDQYKTYPPGLRPRRRDTLPAEVDAALRRRHRRRPRPDASPRLLRASARRSRSASTIPAPTTSCGIAQIPGGMYTNMLAQLQEAKLGAPQGQGAADVVPRGAPRRRRAAPGHAHQPDRRRAGGQLRHRPRPTASPSTRQRHPRTSSTWSRAPTARRPGRSIPTSALKIAGTREETPYDTSAYQKQDNPELPEFGGVRLARGREGGTAPRALPERRGQVPAGECPGPGVGGVAVRPSSVPEPEILNGPWPSDFRESDLSASAGA
ncbi:MAG: hypothetical protein MZU95_09170 [Desulfomicrobium escambiense]|nr:hypothetical protein [Desulfomicrobium escambiense]